MRPKQKQTAHFSYIAVGKIKPNKLNPRKFFDSKSIKELAASFTDIGMIQPIIVFPRDSHFIILCGERRWRAAKMAKLDQLPAIIHPNPPKDETAIAMALIENMHRQNIDVVSESGAIRSLLENYGWSRADLAKKLGVSTGYVRKRWLLSKHSDVIENLDNGKISMSEAVELASIDDNASRISFLEGLSNGRFDSFSHFSKAIARWKYLKKTIIEGHFLSQPLDRSLVQFGVSGLPYCDPGCEHYLRLTWDERRRFGVLTEKAGWREYCSSMDENCYAKKKVAKQKYLQKLQKIEEKRPIPDDGLDSMVWFKYRDKMCRTCKDMVDASEFEAIGGKREGGVYAYCVCKESTCYQKRSKTFERMRKRREHVRRAAEEKHRKRILEQVSTKHSRSNKTLSQYITKRECAYLILQFLCHAGGKQRLEEFAEKYSLNRNMPSKFSSQITYVRNRLMDSIPEGQLIEILFLEAASSAAYSLQRIEPLQFDRKNQREIPILIEAAS